MEKVEKGMLHTDSTMILPPRIFALLVFSANFFYRNVIYFTSNIKVDGDDDCTDHAFHGVLGTVFISIPEPIIGGLL